MIDLPPPLPTIAGTPAGPELVAEAAAGAEAAADAAGVDIRLLHSTEDSVTAAHVLAEVWGRSDALPVVPEFIKVLAHTGHHVTGAFAGDQMIGVCLAFLEFDHPDTIHSHIAGVLPTWISRHAGFALKQHQRAWALARGVNYVEWTFDPLVARNALFNFAKLGAGAADYYVNFYGEMDDAINAGDETDRMLIRWDLRSPKAAAAAAGKRHTVAPDTAGVTWVPIPADIESLRRTDPKAALAHRFALRERLQAAFAEGQAIAGFDREKGYALL
jgi:predicted GNAT superfamily acetyltransferase